jgi:hypothetical protein
VQAGVSIGAVALLDGGGRPIDTLRTGEPLVVQVECRAELATTNAIVEAFIYSADGRVLFCQFTTALDGEGVSLPAGASTIEFSCAELPVQPGPYVICASIREARTQQIHAWRSGPLLTVHPGRMVRGHFYMPHSWRQITTRPSTLASS